jgi:predicted butyrate kinase (DUF1464 family)
MADPVSAPKTKVSTSPATIAAVINGAASARGCAAISHASGSSMPTNRIANTPINIEMATSTGVARLKWERRPRAA